jgi:uncharacterized membrane protein YhaH (DUF805 family)
MDWFFTVIKKYAVFSGRAGRPEYWYFTLIYLLASVLLTFFDIIAGTYNQKTDIGLLSTIFFLALLCPVFAVTVRRLHDIGKSGWWMLISIVPIVGIIVLLVFVCKLGDSTTNRFGPRPDPAS